MSRLKRLFFVSRDGIANTWDNVQLFLLECEIKNLEEELDYEVFPIERHEIKVLLEMRRDSVNKILHRMEVRDHPYWQRAVSR